MIRRAVCFGLFASDRPTSRLNSARGLPNTAALVAGNNSTPPAGPRTAHQPAGAARPGCPDGDADGNSPGAADAAGHLSATGRRNLAARNREWEAVRVAVAGPGGELHVPDTVIGSGGSDGSGRPGHAGKNGRRK